jgi:hypothetical protein
VTDARVAEASRAARDAGASSVELGPEKCVSAPSHCRGVATIGHVGRCRQTAMRGMGQLPSNAAFCRGPAQGYNRLSYQLPSLKLAQLV